jgi:hypothetical protein
MLRKFVNKLVLPSFTSKRSTVEEASMETHSGTIKPNLVVIKQGRVHMIDVTVRHMGYLDERYNSKIGKYTSLLPILAELNMEQGRVPPQHMGTFNYILSQSDTTGQKNYSRAIDNIIRGYNLTDVWETRTARNAFTLYTEPASRIDRMSAEI